MSHDVILIALLFFLTLLLTPFSFLLFTVVLCCVDR
jgi:hypothetical protein